MNEPPIMPTLFCQRCGATNPPYAAQCWLCSTGNRSGASAPAQLVSIASITPEQTGLQSNVRTQHICAVLLVACIVLTSLIGVGIAVQDPGMLIPFVIVIAPAFLATGVRALHGIANENGPKASALLLTFLLSGLFTALGLVLLAIALFVAFCIWCFAQLR
jgi:hypothetical protein